MIILGLFDDNVMTLIVLPIAELVLTPFVVFAHSGNPGEDVFAAICMFNSVLTEEKVDKVHVGKRANKVRRIELSRIVLLCSQRLFEDDWINTSKIRHCARIQIFVD